MLEDRSGDRPAFHQGTRSPARQMTDSVTPNVVHDERLPDIVVRIAIVKLPDIEWIERRDNVNVADGVHAERVQRTIGRA